VCFPFQADLKERRKINGRLPMAEVNKTQQTGSGMTDTQSTRTHGQQAAKDLKSTPGAIAGKVEQTWDDARDRVRIFQEDSNQYVR
jgi:hypothetical protein